LPRLKAAGDLKDYIECIQYPGETMFVPGPWWHGVLNLDDTIAITQNYSNEANFHRVWPCTRVDRKKLACRWLRKLKKHHPSAYKMALEMN